MTQPKPLKTYEREILRARSRVEVADLDSEIDQLIAMLIGKLTKSQHKHYQAARLAEFMGGNAREQIVLRRALLLGLTEQEMKGLTAPDVLTMEESASLVVIMRAMSDWLKECQVAGLISITVTELIAKADDLAQEALKQFMAAYRRQPNVNDVPASLMRLPRARSIKKLADKSGTLLPPPQK